MKKALVFLFLLALASVVDDKFAAGGFNGHPWPNHTEWTEYDVDGDGWVLCRPSTPADSADTPYVCMPLPRGVEVYVPQVVPGPGRDQEQQDRWHRASN